ncbi:MAG: cytochrome c oxidase subunit 3 family protein [Gammaproteobacteria bacterium]|nr:MAG: cytochrome c oxidase subunit 3 family protein [Gammaproteobacteria bacterium]RLA53103.1 MAG: cytochrome c oxidase subunit 3 family protein [Gammaproteobacteria bacterium]
MNESGKAAEGRTTHERPVVASPSSSITLCTSDKSLPDECSAGEHVPGEVGIWVFVLGDMLVFGLFFTVFAYYRGLNIDLYLQSQTSLNQNYGALNTLLLLLSSWFVVMAVSDVRNSVNSNVLKKSSPANKDGLAQQNTSHPSKRAAMLLALAFLCGLGFGLVKIIEYTEKISAGITITSNEFFMYYYIFTGLHFLHVLIGMGVLVFLCLKVRAGISGESDLVLVESGATFWHMVDLLWIVLFPLLYLMK